MPSVGESCSMGFSDAKDVICGYWKEVDGKESGWSHGCCTDLCSDPLMAVSTCVFPCLAAGSISATNGQNGAVSCCMACCCGPCHQVMYRVPDRKKVREGAGATGGYIVDCAIGQTACGMVQEMKAQGKSGFPTFAAPTQEDMK